MSAPCVQMRSDLVRVVERGGRELAARDSHGLHVQLLWDPTGNAISVEVQDLDAGDRFHLAVARERALDAFYHPFAYAA